MTSPPFLSSWWEATSKATYLRQVAPVPTKDFLVWWGAREKLEPYLDWAKVKVSMEFFQDPVGFAQNLHKAEKAWERQVRGRS